MICANITLAFVKKRNYKPGTKTQDEDSCTEQQSIL